MTEVTENRSQAGAELSAADEQVLRELTGRARADGLKLTGEGGLLGKLTKMVIEGAPEGELDDHLGYGKHDPEGRDGGNSRNGYRAETAARCKDHVMTGADSRAPWAPAHQIARSQAEFPSFTFQLQRTSSGMGIAAVRLDGAEGIHTLITRDHQEMRAELASARLRTAPGARRATGD
jgi:hypothetical protein